MGFFPIFFKHQNISPQLSFTSNFSFSIAAVTSVICGFFPLCPSSAHAFLPLFQLWHSMLYMDATRSHNSTTNLLSHLRGGSGASQYLFSAQELCFPLFQEEKQDTSQVHYDTNEARSVRIQVYRNKGLTFSLDQIQALYSFSFKAACQKGFPVKACLLFLSANS